MLLLHVTFLVVIFLLTCLLVLKIIKKLLYYKKPSMAEESVKIQQKLDKMKKLQAEQ